MVEWERRGEALKAIYDAISKLSDSLLRVPEGKRITKFAATYYTANPEQTETLKFYDGADLLFTLTFVWDSQGRFQDVTRTDA